MFGVSGAQGTSNGYTGNNIDSTSTGRRSQSFGRSVRESQARPNFLESLSDWFSGVAKALEDYICTISFPSITRLGKDLKHKVDQSVLDAKIELADSSVDRCRLKAKKAKNQVSYEGEKNIGKAKSLANRFFNQLIS